MNGDENLQKKDKKKERIDLFMGSSLG